MVFIIWNQLCILGLVHFCLGAYYAYLLVVVYSLPLHTDTDLHAVIKKGNLLKDIHKQYIMYQLLKATKYLHSGNVIHRDQKVPPSYGHMEYQ